MTFSRFGVSSEVGTVITIQRRLELSSLKASAV